MEWPRQTRSRTPTRGRHPAFAETATARERSSLDRRDFLREAGIAGGVIVAGSGIVGAAHGDEATIAFPDGRAMVLEKAEGLLEAAVRTENVYMPAGGWVVISRDGTRIGRSIKRLPAGHFERLFVAVEALDPGEHRLRATLYKGDRRDEFPGAGPEPYGDVSDDAMITFE